MTPRCDACTHWKLASYDQRDQHEDDLHGECRRHAPHPWNSNLACELLKQIRVIAGPPNAPRADSADDPLAEDHGWEDAAYGHGFSSWPTTTAADWCGEFKKRKP
jgi:hypothetical protein